MVAVFFKIFVTELRLTLPGTAPEIDIAKAIRSIGKRIFVQIIDKTDKNIAIPEVAAAPAAAVPPKA